MEQKKIGFRLIKIVTEQFAVIEQEINEQEITLQAAIDFGIDAQNKDMGCFCRFKFNTGDKTFIVIDLKCEFKVRKQEWETFVSENSIMFPAGFLRHLATITVGTTRGVLHAKTENTPYNKYFLPTINVNDFVKEQSFSLTE